MKVGGIVLCGGLSRRMGRPKAWLPIGTETMLERVVRQVGAAVEPVVAVAAVDQDLPAVDVEIVRDALPERGPMQGLLAGLQALQGRVEAAFVASCDLPFLEPRLICQLIDLLGERVACVPRVKGFLHPLTAVYRIEIIDIVQRLLNEDRRAMTAIFDAAPTRIVEAEEIVEVHSFRNINDPHQYEAIQKLLGV